jgi:hypothetical protein
MCMPIALHVLLQTVRICLQPVPFPVCPNGKDGKGTRKYCIDTEDRPGQVRSIMTTLHMAFGSHR